jgi:hypothetical protein
MRQQDNFGLFRVLPAATGTAQGIKIGKGLGHDPSFPAPQDLSVEKGVVPWRAGLIHLDP